MHCIFLELRIVGHCAIDVHLLLAVNSPHRKITLGILIGLLSWETCNKRDSKSTYNYWCYSCWSLYLSLILSLLCNIFYRLNEHLCCSRWLVWWGNPDISWFSYLSHILAYVFVHLTVKLVTIASRDTAVYHWSTKYILSPWCRRKSTSS